jgi:5'(3')-deoxyribonucleotidase
MKAIQIQRTGGPEGLEYVDVPTPQPGPAQVLVRAHSIGVNMPEVFVRKGVYRWSPPLPVIPGSREVLEKLTNHYEVFIVSSATEFPQCLPEKQAWLNEHFPFIGWEQMVFCGVKTIIQADIMIDDHFKNLDPFPGKTLLFNQPHNQLAHDVRHTRVFNWMEIDDLLLNGVSLDNRWLLDKTA